jgi:hypothetical protein
MAGSRGDTDRGRRARTEAEMRRRTLDEREIVERSVFTLIREGYLLLDEGIARSAADIDTVWIYGYGFPGACGGPMRYAQSPRPRRSLGGDPAPRRRQPSSFGNRRPLRETRAAAGTFFPQR